MNIFGIKIQYYNFRTLTGIKNEGKLKVVYVVVNIP